MWDAMRPLTPVMRTVEPFGMAGEGIVGMVAEAEHVAVYKLSYAVYSYLVSSSWIINIPLSHLPLVKNSWSEPIQSTSNS